MMLYCNWIDFIPLVDIHKLRTTTVVQSHLTPNVTHYLSFFKRWINLQQTCSLTVTCLCSITLGTWLLQAEALVKSIFYNRKPTGMKQMSSKVENFWFSLALTRKKSWQKRSRKQEFKKELNVFSICMTQPFWSFPQDMYCKHVTNIFISLPVLCAKNLAKKDFFRE